MVLVVTGSIGAGKSSVTKLLSEHFNSKAYYESVEDNPILPLFYTMSEEELAKKRIPFLLQLYFLDTRYKAIKTARTERRAILDRHIEEDWYFARKNADLGRISELEFEIYENLLENMLDEMDEIPERTAEIIIHLKISFENMMKRIKKRSRDYEISDDLISYYKTIWEDYDSFILNKFKGKNIIVLDMDKLDVVHNPDDAEYVKKLVESNLAEFREVDCDKEKEILYNGIRYRLYATSSRCRTFAGEDGSLLKEFKNETRISFGYKGSSGYMSTRVGKRTMSVHRIVADMFLNKNSSQTQVNHIDGDKTNNHIDNLEWVTPKQNVTHAHENGLCVKKEKDRRAASDRLSGENNYFYGSSRTYSTNPNSKKAVAILDGEVIERDSILEVLEEIQKVFPTATRNWTRRIPIKVREKLSFFGRRTDYMVYLIRREKNDGR